MAPLPGEELDIPWVSPLPWGQAPDSAGFEALDADSDSESVASTFLELTLQPSQKKSGVRVSLARILPRGGYH